MARFLVEFRLRGHARTYAEWARARTRREAKQLRVTRRRQPRYVPHITLFGAAETRSLHNVIREVEKVGRRYSRVPLGLGVERGEFQNEDASWLYLAVRPSSELEQFRYELAQSLIRLETRISDTCQPYDRKPKYEFHCSIGKYSPRDKARFQQLADYAESSCSLDAFGQRKASFFVKLLNAIKRYALKAETEDDPGMAEYLLRVTILGRRGRIDAEYDLMLRRMLSRREALSARVWRETIATLRELKSPPREERLSLSAEAAYFIGDTHFDHNNIIRYCGRPFRDVTEMNRVMENNWNGTVGENDRVYFLGDWSFGKGSRPASYWIRRLTGRLVLIQGSHDRAERGHHIKYERTVVLQVGGRSFLLVHDPQDPKSEWIKWQGWIIHGHVHNNQLDRYPFIDGQQKTINVSAEVVKYRPVSLSFLLSLDLDSVKRIRTIDSQPERW